MKIKAFYIISQTKGIFTHDCTLLCLLLISLYGFWINLYLHSLPLGIVIFTVYFTITTVLTGKVFFSEEDFAFRLFYGFSFLLALISIGGTLAYLLYDFSNMPVLITLMTLAVMLLVLSRKKGNVKKTPHRFSQKVVRDSDSNILYLLYIFFILPCFLLLYVSRTGESLRTPWDVVSPFFFVFYFLSNCILLYIIFLKEKNYRTGILLLFLSIQIFLLPSVYFLVLKYPYPERGVASLIAHERNFIKYGKFIWWPGDIERSSGIIHKNFEYIGRFIIIAVFSKFLSLDPFYLDFIIPLIFSIYLPTTTYMLVCYIKPKREKMALVSSLAFLFSQHNIFILVPPTKGPVLALVYLQISIFFWLKYIKRKNNIFVPIIYTIASSLFHQYVAQYALITALVSIYLSHFSPFSNYTFTLQHKAGCTIIKFNTKHFIKSRFKLLIFLAILCISSFSLIFMYLIGDYLGVISGNFNPQWHFGKWIGLIFPPIQDHPELPFFERLLYFFLDNFSYVLYFLILLGLLYSFVIKVDLDWVVVTITLILVSFSNMIIQEFFFPDMGWAREYYRFVVYMNFVSFVLVGIAIYWLINRYVTRIRISVGMLQKERVISILLIVLVSLSMTASLYGGFPRKWSMGPYLDYPKYVSDYDIAAMKFIKNVEEINYPISFFILGDVYTCSAGLLEIGEVRLTKDGKKYSIYSSWVDPSLWSIAINTPSLQLFEEIVNLTGAERIYLILSYRIAMVSQEHFHRLLEDYKVLLGDPIFEIEEKIYVFRYEINERKTI